MVVHLLQELFGQREARFVAKNAVDAALRAHRGLSDAVRVLVDPPVDIRRLIDGETIETPAPTAGEYFGAVIG